MTNNKICQYCKTDHSHHRPGASYACGPKEYHHLRPEDWPEGTRPFYIPEITGRINLTRHYGVEPQNEITAEWEGGDIVAFSQELLKDANPRWLHRYPGAIQCCQFRLEIVGEDDRGDVYARRVRE